MSPYVYPGTVRLHVDNVVVDIPAVIEVVCTLMDVSKELITTVRCRRARVFKARAMAWTLLEKLAPQFPLAEVGREFGGFHHTTVLHGRRSFAKMLETDAEIARKYRACRRELVGY